MRFEKENREKRLQVRPDNGIYYVRCQVHRKRICKSTGTTNFHKALRRMNRILSEELGAHALRREVRFKDLIPSYIKNKQGRAPKTIRGAEDHCKKLEAFFGSYHLGAVTEETWKAYTAHSRVKTPGRRLYDDHKHFTSLMRAAYREGLTKRLLHVPQPKEITEAGREYSEGEILAFLKKTETCAKSQKKWNADLRLQILISCLGMRFNEILKLEWDRVDFAKRELVLMVKDTKTSLPRKVKMNETVLNALRDRFKKRVSPYVFPNRIDPSRPRTSNATAWKRLRRELNIKGRWHDLRHTAATRLVRKGYPEKIVTKHLGMSPKVLNRYLHISEEDAVAMSESLELSKTAKSSHKLPEYGGNKWGQTLKSRSK